MESVLSYLGRWLTCYREKERVDVTVSFDASTYRQSGGLQVQTRRSVVEDLSRDRSNDLVIRIGWLCFITLFLVSGGVVGYLVMPDAHQVARLDLDQWICGIIGAVLLGLLCAIVVQVILWSVIVIGDHIFKRVLAGSQSEKQEADQALQRFKVFTAARLNTGDGDELISTSFPLSGLFAAMEEGGKDVISFAFRILSEVKDDRVNRKLASVLQKLIGDDLSAAIKEYGSLNASWIDNALIQVVTHATANPDRRQASEALERRLKDGVADREQIVEQLKELMPKVDDAPRIEMVRFLRNIGAGQVVSEVVTGIS